MHFIFLWLFETLEAFFFLLIFTKSQNLQGEHILFTKGILFQKQMAKTDGKLKNFWIFNIFSDVILIKREQEKYKHKYRAWRLST